mmetsp:Transcript_25143/g.71634  ORF Transcript_25143/g.71634 Transcript_25143/m.71634 type:complete len:92 (-) Transcript_25143:27-302(-)
MRDAEGVVDIALPVDSEETVQFAIPRHQAQGVFCLEVVFKTGVPVRVSPDRRAATVATKRFGEYVFADAQNFNGWLKLAGEQGAQEGKSEG